MAGNPPSTPESPTSGGFNTDQLPHTSRTSENFSDEEEAAVDPQIIRDEAEDLPDEEEEEGEDLFHDNFMESVTLFLSLILSIFISTTPPLSVF